MILMTTKAQQIRKLVDQLNGHMQDEFVKKEEDEEVIERCYRYDSKLSKFILVFSIALAISSMTKPFISTLRKHFKQK